MPTAGPPEPDPESIWQQRWQERHSSSREYRLAHPAAEGFAQLFSADGWQAVETACRRRMQRSATLKTLRLLRCRSSGLACARIHGQGPWIGFSTDI
jgi:hypothetical protein